MTAGIFNKHLKISNLQTTSSVVSVTGSSNPSISGIDEHLPDYIRSDDRGTIKANSLFIIHLSRSQKYH